MTNELTYSFTVVLLHSLWISAAILGIVKVLLTLISQERSKLRYAIATGGLISLLLAIGVTWAVLTPENTPFSATNSVGGFVLSETISGNDQPLPLFEGFVATYSHLILSGWLIGTTFFLLRVTGGLWYIHRVVRSGNNPGGHTLALFQRIASRYELRIRVRLIESALTNVPFVAGIFKPFVVLPAGFATGISLDQLEAVLAHELAHIKRHDYLINILQAIVEALFFFNPFVWILSAMIRCEREHVCDDAVVELGFDKLVYVRTLATLEETRLEKNVPALSFADEKKLLLYRIKRLMENSIKTPSAGERLLPVALLIIGLGCAAWMTIDKTPAQNVNDDFLIQSDTIKKPVKPVPPETVDAPAFPSMPQIYISEDVSVPPDFDVDIPEIPEIDIPEFDIPEIPDFPEFDAFFLQPDEFDSIPFGRAFYKQFEFDRHGGFNFSELNFSELMSKVEAIQEQIPQILESVQEMRVAEIAQRDMALVHEAMSKHQEVMQNIQSEMLREQSVLEEQMRVVEKEAHEMQKRTVSLHKELREQLIKDGYLSPNEKIERLQIDNDGNIRVNDIELRESDRATYKKIVERHTNGADPTP